MPQTPGPYREGRSPLAIYEVTVWQYRKIMGEVPRTQLG